MPQLDATFGESWTDGDGAQFVARLTALKNTYDPNYGQEEGEDGLLQWSSDEHAALISESILTRDADSSAWQLVTGSSLRHGQYVADVRQVSMVTIGGL